MTAKQSHLPPVEARKKPGGLRPGPNSAPLNQAQARQERVKRLRRDILENRYKPESRKVAAAIIGSLLGED